MLIAAAHCQSAQNDHICFNLEQVILLLIKIDIISGQILHHLHGNV